MKKTTRTVLSVVAIFLLGYATANWHSPAPDAQEAKPAYLIISAEWLEPDKLGPYREAAVPLAQAAGAQILGGGDTGSTLELLEGEWPYEGRVSLQRFDSMDALLGFWNSSGYQEARKLREGFFDANFIVAFEGN